MHSALNRVLSLSLQGCQHRQACCSQRHSCHADPALKPGLERLEAANPWLLACGCQRQAIAALLSDLVTALPPAQTTIATVRSVLSYFDATPPARESLARAMLSQLQRILPLRLPPEVCLTSRWTPLDKGSMKLWVNVTVLAHCIPTCYKSLNRGYAHAHVLKSNLVHGHEAVRRATILLLVPEHVQGMQMGEALIFSPCGLLCTVLAIVLGSPLKSPNIS